MIEQKTWHLNPLRYVAPAPLQVKDIETTVKRHQDFMDAVEHKVFTSKLTLSFSPIIHRLHAQEPASVWFLRYLKEEASRMGLCSLCAELRGQESAIILRNKDPEKAQKEKQKKAIHVKYMNHRCINSSMFY